MWEDHGAPKLDHLIRRFPGVRPRNVTARPEEREALHAAAEPWLRLMLLLCEDTAIRSGTAQRLSPEHYNQNEGTFNFTTKMGEKLTLPTTEEITSLLDQCSLDSSEPFVRQLWQQTHRDSDTTTHTRPLPRYNSEFVKLRKSIGITRKLTFHDFRRTAAVGMYELTHDLRDVQALLGHRSLQSTVWYLDHNLRPVVRANLERIKERNTRKEPAA